MLNPDYPFIELVLIALMWFVRKEDAEIAFSVWAIHLMTIIAQFISTMP